MILTAWSEVGERPEDVAAAGAGEEDGVEEVAGLPDAGLRGVAPESRLRGSRTPTIRSRSASRGAPVELAAGSGAEAGTQPIVTTGVAKLRAVVGMEIESPDDTGTIDAPAGDGPGSFLGVTGVTGVQFPPGFVPPVGAAAAAGGDAGGLLVAALDDSPSDRNGFGRSGAA
jgi:hypothetical protein